MVRRLKLRTGEIAVPARLVVPDGAGSVGVVLAHGAGAGQDHPWMVTMRDLLAGQGVTTMTFDYAYVAEGRKAPDRPPKLLAVHRAAVERMGRYCDRIVLAGKSMGGRMASHLVGDEGVAASGLIYYGYPLVPLGKGEPRSTAHLQRIEVPQLFFAGTRDRLSPPSLVEPLTSRLVDGRVVVVEDADHSFNVPKRTGITQPDVLERIATTTAEWIERYVPGTRRECT
jgi:predicted alpha/beta-hydrolase family hydrolase